MSEPVLLSMMARPVRQRSLLTHVSAVSAANSSGGGDKFSGKTSSNSSVGPASNPCARRWTLLTKVETSCDRILIAGGANVEAEWEQGPAV